MPDDETRTSPPEETVEPVPGGGVIRGEVYQPTFKENLKAFLDGAALRFSSKRILVVGPYAGEFGSEIMDFQGYVHWLRPKYREVHVITFPGREPLYRGCVVHVHDFDLRTAGYNFGRISNREIDGCARAFAAAQGFADFDMFNTMHLRSRWHRRIFFRQKPEIVKPLIPIKRGEKIVFHFRNIDKRGFDRSRNFRPELAAELVKLSVQIGFKVACIGHPKYSLCPAGCEDRRTEDLEQTVADVAASRIVAGELSGPLHLAAYCGRPIVIWAPGRNRIAHALKRNPFNVNITVVRDDTTNPPPGEILSGIQNAVAGSLETARPD